MKNFLIEIYQNAPEKLKEISKEVGKRRRHLKSKLEICYAGNLLEEKFGISKDLAININLSDQRAINETYFRLLPLFYAMSVRWLRNNQNTAQTVSIEDIVNQIYVDMRYYDYSSEKSFRKSVYLTCRTTENGGIKRYQSYLEEVKAVKFLSSLIIKTDEEISLIDCLTAKEERSNPESIVVSEEERKIFKETVLKEILSVLPLKKRRKIVEVLGYE